MDHDSGSVLHAKVMRQSVGKEQRSAGVIDVDRLPTRIWRARINAPIPIVPFQVEKRSTHPLTNIKLHIRPACLGSATLRRRQDRVELFFCTSPRRQKQARLQRILRQSRGKKHTASGVRRYVARVLLSAWVIPRGSDSGVAA